MHRWILLSINFLPLLIMTELYAQLIVEPDYYRYGKYQWKRPLSYENFQFNFMEKKILEDKDLLRNLAESKFFMINGNLDMARLKLAKNEVDRDFARPIRFRYLALLSYLQEDYKKALDYLSLKDFIRVEHFKHICLLKTLSYIGNEQIKKAEYTWARCRKENLAHSQYGYLWADTLFQLKFNAFKSKNYKKENLSTVVFESQPANLLRIYLQLALYMSKHERTYKGIKIFNKEILSLPRIRELIGQLYLRGGKVKLGYHSVNDLNLPNALNMIGNIHYKVKNWDKAFQAYTYALEVKNDSRNALERLIPLSFQLEKYQSGIDYINRLMLFEDSLRELTTLKSFFLIKQKKLEAAYNLLKEKNFLFQLIRPKETLQLQSYLNLYFENLDHAKKHYWVSCLQNDGISCSVLAYLNLWDNLGKSMKQEEIGPQYLEDDFHEAEFNNLISKRMETPIKEEIFIDQKEIEELDNNIIKLIRTKIMSNK
ncbi:hypothetical protein N9N67_09770 [Bacteriovoracaceae bacterium]|nr:hypothetical protein [Bacteriovoracaceae bacterium]